MFHDDHRRWKGWTQLSQAKGDQLEYVGIGDEVQLGSVLDDEHGFFLYFGHKKARSV